MPFLVVLMIDVPYDTKGYSTGSQSRVLQLRPAVRRARLVKRTILDRANHSPVRNVSEVPDAPLQQR